MHMHLSSNITNLLFEGWNSYSPFDLFIMCVVTSMITICYQAFLMLYTFFILKVHQNPILYSRDRLNINENQHGGEMESLQSLISTISLSKIKRIRKLYYIAESAMYMLLNLLGYLIMLFVMTHNGWFVIAVLFGVGLGYFMFGTVVVNLSLRLPKVSYDNTAFQGDTVGSVSSNTEITTETGNPSV